MRMDEGYKVRAEVVKVRRHCPLAHKVGDAWEIGETTPEGLCIFAFLAFAPAWSTLRTGGRFSWSEDPNAAEFGCPDQGEVVFKLQRIKKKRSRRKKKNQAMDDPEL